MSVRAVTESREHTRRFYCPPGDLRAVTVRPTRGGRGHRLRDRLAGEHHHLRFHGIVGKGLLPGSRRTAGSGSRRAAGRRALAARDRWIGWPRELQFRHPHPIRDSSRPVILTPGRVPDLASRVPGLSM